MGKSYTTYIMYNFAHALKQSICYGLLKEKQFCIDVYVPCPIIYILRKVNQFQQACLFSFINAAFLIYLFRLLSPITKLLKTYTHLCKYTLPYVPIPIVKASNFMQFLNLNIISSCVIWLHLYNKHYTSFSFVKQLIALSYLFVLFLVSFVYVSSLLWHVTIIKY